MNPHRHAPRPPPPTIVHKLADTEQASTWACPTLTSQAYLQSLGYHLGMDGHVHPPPGVSCATCPIPRALYVSHPTPRCTSPDTVPWYLPPGAPYLGQGSYYGTFHNASQEDQVQFCSARGIGEGSQVVQDLLHGWGEG